MRVDMKEVTAMKNTRPFYAYLDELDMITVIMPVSYLEEEVSFFQLETDGVLHDLEIVEKRELDGEKKYVCKSPVQPLFGKTHYIIDERGGRTDLQIGAVIRTDAFDDQFYYPANDLGAVYEPKATSFKVWAPTAVRAVLLLKKKNEEKALSIEMTRDKNGVYSLIVPGDLEGSFYRYKVLINNEWREAADPYSRAVSIHSEWSSIIDDRKTYVKPIQPAPLPSPLDAIIYEISIRDFSIHPESGMLHKGKYLALTEAQTSGKKGTPTGLSYLKELGITHVEFLPFNDFYGVPDDNPSAAYNWGYNPLFFNVPEGSYSSDPTNPYSRVVELKKMIEAVHETGLRVIMDVVYNHVYIRETSPFEILVPGYYFRHDQHGLPSNGTGVGNDFASERKMARAFILHSLEYWITEFNIDGFRFDLMGILDIQTMTEAKKIISKHKKDCLLLGEGWDLNTPLAREKKANMRNQQLLPGIGQFNDWFRDTIKGSTFNLYDSGYSFGRKSLAGDAFQVIAGSVGLGHNRGIFATPEQSINYVESHDNNTLWDKLEACFPGEIEKNKKRH
ncbi:MAG TPA: type I pullulanase, partial [Chondromyces sp.]|nr:type I pullulanase [Chondromyces sp.]